jgi:pilus assembly protein FimV
MGQELNPTNPLYGALGAAASPVDIADSDRDFAASETTAEADDNSFDFNIDDLASFTPETEEAAPSIPAEEDLSFDLSGDDMGDAGEGTLASSDEVATKLDLARAYIEMGDPEGARSILDEVMQEGDAAQKSEAQGMLQKMS